MFTTELLILLPESTPSAALLISVDGNSGLLGVEVPTTESFSAFPSSTPHHVRFVRHPVEFTFNTHPEFDHFLPPQQLPATLSSHLSLGLQ